MKSCVSQASNTSSHRLKKRETYKKLRLSLNKRVRISNTPTPKGITSK